jgi:hypothetical protein
VSRPPFDREAVLAWRVIIALLVCFWLALIAGISEIVG